MAVSHPCLGSLPAPYSVDKPPERCLALSWNSTHPLGSRSRSSRIWGGSLRGLTFEDLSPQLKVSTDCHLQSGALPSLQTQLLRTSAGSSFDTRVTSTPHLISASYFPPQQSRTQSLPSPLSASPLSVGHKVPRFLPHSISGTRLLLSRQPIRSWLPGHGQKCHCYHIFSQTFSDSFLSYCCGTNSNPLIVTGQAPALMPAQLCQLMSVFDP